MEQTVSTEFSRREVFAKLRAHDRMCHKTTYAWLEGFVVGRARPDLRLVDLGCNDARDMAGVLASGAVADYVGADPDAICLAGARDNLDGVPATVSLRPAQALETLNAFEHEVDVIWMGLLLHHFPAAGKTELFRAARRALRPGGSLLTCDPMPGPGEDVPAYLARFNAAIATQWTELTPQEREVLIKHWTDHGRHDRVEVVTRLAREAGFTTIWNKRLDEAGLYALMRFAA